MAKPIVVRFKGEESRFDFSKLERKKLYGSRRRVNLDGNGEPCARAKLTEDGRFLLRSGMTSRGYFTDAGKWIPNKELQGIAEGGGVVEKVAGTLGVAQTLEGCEPQELLDHRLTAVYMLEAQDLDAKLEKALADGSIFRFPFNYRPDFRAETGFLLQNDEGVFALVGVRAESEWVENTSAPPLIEEEIDEDDELDFEMF